jgi:hypothetical protein
VELIDVRHPPESRGGRHGLSEDLRYRLRVTNAGPAVARDLTIQLVVWTDAPGGFELDSVDVAPALLRGEQREMSLLLCAEEAKFDDINRSIEIHAAYYDDNGVRSGRLAFVFEDDLVLSPPQPSPALSRGH